MTQKLQTCVVQIRSNKDAQAIVGTGFVVSADTIVTCAHVVEQALATVKQPKKTKQELAIALALTNEPRVAQIVAIDEKNDIAVLHIPDGLPEGVLAAILGPSEDAARHNFSAFGYPPVDGLVGIWADGTILGPVLDQNNQAYLQIRAQEIEQGMSGAPVLDINDDRVVGMVTKTYTPKGARLRFRDLALATPAETLKEIWPWLQLNPSPIGTRFIVPSPPNPNFVGRSEELALLHEIITYAESAVGIRPTKKIERSGIGKTQLALEYVHSYRHEYPDGVFWLNAANPLINEFAKLAEDLSLVEEGESPTRGASKTWHYLNSRPGALVIFDNLEQPYILNKPLHPELDLRPTRLSCRKLFTTRNRFYTTRRFQALEMDVLSEGAAVDLLTPSRHEHPDEQHPLLELARALSNALGRHPLALKLAAAFMTEYNISLDEYLELIEDERNLAVRDPEALPEKLTKRHQAAVKTTLRIQWDDLEDEHARLLFRITGQFPKGQVIPIAWLGMLAGITVTALSRSLKKLHDVELIEELTDNEIRLHPSVQGFAASLTPKDTRKRFQEALETNLIYALGETAYRRERAIPAGECLQGLGWQTHKLRPYVIAALSEVMVSQDISDEDRRISSFLLLHLRWLDEITDLPVDDILVFLDQLDPYLDSKEDRDYIIEKITAIPKMMPLDRRQEIQFLISLAKMFARSGLSEVGRDAIDIALRLFDKSMQVYSEAAMLMPPLATPQSQQREYYKWFSQIYLGIGNILRIYSEIKTSDKKEEYSLRQQALEKYQEALNAAEAYAQDTIQIVRVLFEMTYTHTLLQNWSEGKAHYGRALEILEPIRSSDRIAYARHSAMVLEKATILHWDCGESLDTPQALSEFLQAHHWAQEAIRRLKGVLDNSEDMAYAQFNAGECLLQLKNYEGEPKLPVESPIAKACEHWRRAFDIAHNLALADIEGDAQDYLKQYCSQANPKGNEQ